jgi:hypothetical protein
LALQARAISLVDFGPDFNMSGIPNFVAACSAAVPIYPVASCMIAWPGCEPAAGAAADAPDVVPDVDAVIFFALR